MFEGLLNSKGGAIVQAIRSNIQRAGQNASGRTSNSLKTDVTENDDFARLTISGAPWFFTLETGRRPTKSGAPESNPNLYSKIAQWIKDKPVIGGNASAITKAIHEKGTRLFQKGGRKDIFSNVITEEKVRDIQDQIANITLKATADGIIERYNKR